MHTFKIAVLAATFALAACGSESIKPQTEKDLQELGFEESEDYVTLDGVEDSDRPLSSENARVQEVIDAQNSERAQRAREEYYAKRNNRSTE